MENVEIVTGGAELLDTVAPLWQRLNEHHAAVSPHFSEFVRSVTFSARREGLARKAQSGKLRVDIARSKDGGADVGYCISSISAEGVGEVESIFIENAFRRHGIGALFMNAAMKWMDENGVEKRVVAVACGNERAWPFYAKFGFFPRVTTLVRKS